MVSMAWELSINPFWVPTQDNYKEWLENFSADFDLCWLIGCNYGSSGHGTRRSVAQLRQQTWRRGFLRIISPSRGLSIGVEVLGVRGDSPNHPCLQILHRFSRKKEEKLRTLGSKWRFAVCLWMKNPPNHPYTPWCNIFHAKLGLSPNSPLLSYAHGLRVVTLVGAVQPQTCLY